MWTQTASPAQQTRKYQTSNNDKGYNRKTRKFFKKRTLRWKTSIANKKDGSGTKTATLGITICTRTNKWTARVTNNECLERAYDSKTLQTNITVCDVIDSQKPCYSLKTGMKVNLCSLHFSKMFLMLKILFFMPSPCLKPAWVFLVIQILASFQLNSWLIVRGFAGVTY